MDFFYRNLEAAQEQARSLSITASNSAKGFAEQLTEHTKTLAEQVRLKHENAILPALQPPYPQHLQAAEQGELAQIL